MPHTTSTLITGWSKFHSQRHFPELFGSGLVDLCGSYSVSFLSKAICQDVTEKAVSKPEALMFDVYFLGSFISESSQRRSVPPLRPHQLSPSGKGTHALCHVHALCLQVALGTGSACSTSWHCAEHRRKHLLLV